MSLKRFKNLKRHFLKFRCNAPGPGWMDGWDWDRTAGRSARKLQMHNRCSYYLFNRQSVRASGWRILCASGQSAKQTPPPSRIQAHHQLCVVVRVCVVNALHTARKIIRASGGPSRAWPGLADGTEAAAGKNIMQKKREQNSVVFKSRDRMGIFL